MDTYTCYYVITLLRYERKLPTPAGRSGRSQPYQGGRKRPISGFIRDLDVRNPPVFMMMGMFLKKIYTIFIEISINNHN